MRGFTPCLPRIKALDLRPHDPFTLKANTRLRRLQNNGLCLDTKMRISSTSAGWTARMIRPRLRKRIWFNLSCASVNSFWRISRAAESVLKRSGNCWQRAITRWLPFAKADLAFFGLGSYTFVGG